jgi:hypothetical protein
MTAAPAGREARPQGPEQPLSRVAEFRPGARAVYTDRRQLGLFLDSKVVVDATPTDAIDRLAPLAVRVAPLQDGQSLDRKFAAIADSLADELAARLDGCVGRAVIRAQVGTALEDLRGSVSFDSLAEMAVRLAEHRLRSPGAQR